MLNNFSVNRRNYGHWDIWDTKRRIFRIRGGPGKYLAIDERKNPCIITEFKAIGTCMQFICDKLMYELIIAEGQEVQTIEKWNV